jgi:hypothetical protein
MRDPIFQCIENHRKAFDEFTIACGALDDLESELDKKTIREPRVQYGWLSSWTDAPRKPLYLNSHDEIETYIDDEIETHRSRFDGVPNMVTAGVVHLEERRADLHAALEADAVEQQRRREMNGFAAAEARNDAAGEAERVAAIAFLTTTPTSFEGIAAAIRYAEDFSFNGKMWPAEIEQDENPFDGLPWHIAFHRNIARAMAAIVPPPTTMNKAA